MATFTIARNNRTSLYEVHKAGCAHTRLGHMDFRTDVEGTDGDTIARESAERNEGWGYTTGPCVKRGPRATYWGE